MMKYTIMHEADLNNEGWWEHEEQAIAAAKKAIAQQGNSEPFVVVLVTKVVRVANNYVVEDP